MSKNTEKLPKSILEGVRESLRQGIDESIPVTETDNIINQMTARDLLMEWSAWEFGTPSWGAIFIDTYENLKN